MRRGGGDVARGGQQINCAVTWRLFAKRVPMADRPTPDRVAAWRLEARGLAVEAAIRASAVLTVREASVLSRIVRLGYVVTSDMVERLIRHDMQQRAAKMGRARRRVVEEAEEEETTTDSRAYWARLRASGETML